jgi:hypothetical protein
MHLRAIVARNRFNPPESGRPFVESEYVLDETQGELELSPVPEVKWTTDRTRAHEMPWPEADRLASQLGFPAQAYVIGAPAERVAKPAASAACPHISPSEVFERLERQHLA